MKIKHWQTLEYNDGILLFTAIAPCGAEMLAVMVEYPNTFLVVPLIDPQRQALMDGKRELREMFANPIPEAWWTCEVQDWEELELKQIEKTKVTDDWLPGEGCWMNGEFVNEDGTERKPAYGNAHDYREYPTDCSECHESLTHDDYWLCLKDNHPGCLVGKPSKCKYAAFGKVFSTPMGTVTVTVTQNGLKAEIKRKGWR